MSGSHVTKRSISLELETESQGRQRAERLGFKNSFSAYINQLIRQELEREARNGKRPERLEEQAA